MNLYEYFGLLAPIVAFVSIAVAIFTHPWFSLAENAISDLGAVGVEKNYILNAGLIISGIFATIFALGTLLEQKSFLGRLGGVYFLLGAVCLALIGVFPEGTPQHLPVSVAFFTLAPIGAFFIGISSEDSDFAAFTILLTLVEALLAILCLYWFEGVAMTELVLFCCRCGSTSRFFTKHH